MIAVQDSLQSVKYQKQESFKGNYAKNSNGTSYYQTNSALKIGGINAAIAVGSTLFLAPKSVSKNIISIALPIITHLGSAMFIDYMRNKESAKVAEEIKTKGLRRAIRENDKIMISRKGHGYSESDTGAKYGGWLGAIFGTIRAMNPKLYPKGSSRILNLLSATLGVGIAAFGGYLLGCWSDNIANKDSRKNA